MYRLLPIFALAACLACNGDDLTPTEPTPPGGSIPTIGGTYTSPTLWTFQLTTATESENFQCAGTFTIATQVGESFNGTYQIADESCGGRFAGTFVNGVFRPDTTVTFELLFAEGSANFLASAFGCTYVSGDRVMNGTLVGNRLEAQARTELDCPASAIVAGRATQVIRLAGNR